MEDDQNPNPNSPSSFKRTVFLSDWWLIKCPIESQGKRFGVAGIEIRSRAMRVFTSSPIINVVDVFTLEASDGICINLQGFLNKDRLVKCGFSSKISREFVFGFPPCWEKLCNDCFKGEESDINIDQGCNPILSPCENKKDNSLAESRGNSTVNEKSVVENNDKDGCIGGSRAGDEETVRRNSLCVQSNNGGEGLNNEDSEGKHDENGSEGLDQAKSSEGEKDDESKVDESKVQNRTNDGACGSGGLDQAKSSDVEDEVILPEDTGESWNSEQRKDELKVTGETLLSELHKSRKPGKKEKSKKTKKSTKTDGKVGSVKNKTKVQNSTIEGDQGSESLNKAKSVDVEDDECEAIVDEMIARFGKRHSSTGSVEKVTSENPVREPLTSEQRKGKPGKPKTQSLVNDLDNNSKFRRSGRSKKSEKTRKSGKKVIESVNYTRSKGKEAKETLSWGKTIRKINFDAELTPEKKAKKAKKKQKTVFDFEVTPVKEAKKKNETNADSTASVAQKRSRSGRALVSPLEFWRNQVAVYDKDRNLIQVNDRRHETPSKGIGSGPRTAKKRKIK